jgi:TRAP-type C4-dicarboxylate transport system permease small subunit
MIGAFLFVSAAIALVIAIVKAIEDGDGWPPVWAAAALIPAGTILLFFAQLLHIRAALESRRDEVEHPNS